MIDEEDYPAIIDMEDSFDEKDIIQVRYNGKFFTGVFCAKSATGAFEQFVETLLEMGYITNDHKKMIIKNQFKLTLMTADDAIVSFMWDRAIKAEKNDVKIVYSVFDYGGWRFFGRI
jgi:hypothetical protein